MRTSSQDSHEGRELDFEKGTQAHSNVWYFTFLNDSKCNLIKNGEFISEGNVLNFVMKGNSKKVLGCENFRLGLIPTLKDSSALEHLRVQYKHKDINALNSNSLKKQQHMSTF